MNKEEAEQILSEASNSLGVDTAQSKESAGAGNSQSIVKTSCIAAAAALAHAPDDGSAAGSSAASTTGGSMAGMAEGVSENIWGIQCAVGFCQSVKDTNPQQPWNYSSVEFPTRGSPKVTRNSINCMAKK